MESKALNIILGLLSALSFIWSFISPENRTIAIIIAFILIILILISEKNIKLENLVEEQKKLGERLKIYERLASIEARINILENKENGKRK